MFFIFLSDIIIGLLFLFFSKKLLFMYPLIPALAEPGPLANVVHVAVALRKRRERRLRYRALASVRRKLKARSLS